MPLTPRTASPEAVASPGYTSPQLRNLCSKNTHMNQAACGHTNQKMRACHVQPSAPACHMSMQESFLFVRCHQVPPLSEQAWCTRRPARVHQSQSVLVVSVLAGLHVCTRVRQCCLKDPRSHRQTGGRGGDALAAHAGAGCDAAGACPCPLVSWVGGWMDGWVCR